MKKAGNSRVIFLFKQSMVFVGGFGIASDQVREAWVFFEISVLIWKETQG